MEKNILEARFPEMDAGDRDGVTLGQGDELRDPPLPFLHGHVQDILMETIFFDPVEGLDLVHEGLGISL